VPLLSFAAAANLVDSFGKEHNFNMMSEKNGWPTKLPKEHAEYPNAWQHSDFWLVNETNVK
jgi:hypothetical protein